MEEKQNQCLIKKDYVPHKLRSRPFRFIGLPIYSGIIFLAYWLMFCPLLFVSVNGKYLKYYIHDWPTWWPFAFWTVALLVFIIIMLIIISIWLCVRKKDREEEIVARKQEYDTLLRRNTDVKHPEENDFKNTVDKTEKDDKGKENAKNLNKELTDYINEKKQTSDESDKLFPKCSVKRKPDLSLKCISQTPSQEPNADSPKSPLTPRELFFIDLIEAANKSPATYIPETQTFLEMERKHCLPDDGQDDENPEFFIANVPNRRSLTTQIFMYVNATENEKQFRITPCEDECCLLPNQVLIPQLQQTSNRVTLASPQLAQQSLPLQLEYLCEPEFLACSNDQNLGGQTVDCIRHLYLGTTPRAVKQCVRCGSCSGTQPVTRTAAIRAWDQRWIRSCQCGGLWRYHAEN